MDPDTRNLTYIRNVKNANKWEAKLEKKGKHKKINISKGLVIDYVMYIYINLMTHFLWILLYWPVYYYLLILRLCIFFW